MRCHVSWLGWYHRHCLPKVPKSSFLRQFDASCFVLDTAGCMALGAFCFFSAIRASHANQRELEIGVAKSWEFAFNVRQVPRKNLGVAGPNGFHVRLL